jgi:sialic acid synthase SpsE
MILLQMKNLSRALIAIKKTIVIAEAGVNRNGDKNIARELIDVADKAGADYVKFKPLAQTVKS